MSASTEGVPGDVKSHELQDISESATPSIASQSSNKDIADTASSKGIKSSKGIESVNPADIPLSASRKNVEGRVASGEETSETVPATESAQTTTGGGGVFGIVRSIFGGSSPATTTATEPEIPQAEPEVTHEATLNSGTQAQVATAPGHSAVPDSLKAGSSPVGVARTTFSEPVSDFAPALTKIAGDPEPSDPTTKYGHAFDSLTGDVPVASSPGVITSVTNAATSAVTSAVETVKHAVGYENPEETVGTSTGTGDIASSPGTLTMDDLPKTGRILPHEDGSIDVTPGQASSLAARKTEPSLTSQGISSGAAPTSGAVSSIDKEVPRSGTVNTSSDGTASIESAPRQGIIASAVGSVTGGAQLLKDSVAGLVGSGQAGDTSEQIAALDKQNAPVEKTPIAYEKEPVAYESAGAGPYPQSTSANQAGPVVQEKPAVAYEDSAPTGRDQISETSLTSGPAPTGRDQASGTSLTSGHANPKASTAPTSSASTEPVSRASEPTLRTPAGVSSSAVNTPAAASQAVKGTSSSPAVTPGGPSSAAPASSAAAAVAPTAATASEKPSSASTVKPTSESTTSPLVKEVGPVPSNATPESTTRSGKENVRLPTGDVVEAEKPAASSTASKAAGGSPSSKPVVSAFAKPSTEAAKSTTPATTATPTETSTKSATNPTSSTVPGKTEAAVGGATGASKPTAAAEKAVTGPTGGTQGATGITEGAASKATGAKDAITPASAEKDAKATGTVGKAGTEAEKAAKKDKKTCGCCTIS